jgi:regulator of protease activity HflC (stomatin/prohibitin superfamily)
MKNLILITILGYVGFSCTSVDSGHTGVKLNYGSETDMNKVYEEDFYFGLNWLFDDIIEYETREKTITIQDTYLDTDGVPVPINAIIVFQVLPNNVNKLHKEIGPDYVNTKIIPTVDPVLKNIVSQYKVLELNNTYRIEADSKLSEELKKEFPNFYVRFVKANFSKVDLPEQIKTQIIAKQVQDEKNLLAEKIEKENFNLGRAKLVKDSLEYEASKYVAKTKDVLSSPKMLELFEAETKRVWADKGISPFGSNNVFGDAGVLKSYIKQ